MAYKIGLVGCGRIAGNHFKAIEEEHGAHYKALDLYGRQAGLFATEFKAHLEANPIQEDVVCTLASPVVRDVLEVLQENASQIVRGF